MQTLKLYSPLRVWYVFKVLLTLYLLIRKRERFLIFSPLSASKLVQTITLLGASFIKLAQDILEKSLKESLSPLITGLVLLLSGIFVLQLDRSLEAVALILFSVGLLRLTVRK